MHLQCISLQAEWAPPDTQNSLIKHIYTELVWRYAPRTPSSSVCSLGHTLLPDTGSAGHAPRTFSSSMCPSDNAMLPGRSCFVSGWEGRKQRKQRYRTLHKLLHSRNLDSGMSRLPSRANVLGLRCRRLRRTPELRQSLEHLQHLAGAGARARVLQGAAPPEVLDALRALARHAA